MMNISNKRIFIPCFLFSTLVACLPFSAAASGTYIPLQSVADLGNSFAGNAANGADDASTNYTNPAGLVMIHNKQLVIAGSLLASSTEFNGRAGSSGIFAPYMQSGSANSDTAGIIPAFHFAYPISDDLVAGVSLHSPYGLGVDYGDSSIVRYNVGDAFSASSELSPSLAYKFNNHLSFGAGPDLLYLSLKESYAAYLVPFSTDDGAVNLGVKGVGYGWHAGVMYQFNPDTRLGLVYHSQIAETLRGYNDFIVNNGPLAGYYTSDSLKAKITLPPLTNLSFYHQFYNSPWALLGSVEYAQWDVYKNETIYNSASPMGLVPLANIPRNWRNTWRFGLATNYQLTSKWLLRLGGNYEQSPTRDDTRDVIFPDSNHFTLGLGARYLLSKDVKIDFGYVHIFYKNAPINYTSPIAGGSVIQGESSQFINSFGLQVVWNI